MQSFSGPIAGPSAQALDYVKTVGVSQPTLNDINNLVQVRNDGHQEYQPRARRALKRHKVEWQQIEVAGIPCIEAIPAERQYDRTILYCFGGGYVYGGAFDDLCISAPISRHANARIVAPMYSLAPESAFPAAVDECFAVYQFLCKQSGEAGFAIAGESAGGNLALSLMLKARKAGLAMPVAAALLSPWCDLNPLSRQAGVCPQDPTLHEGDLDNYADIYARDNDRCNPLISPLYAAFDGSFPPVMITTGTRDVLLHQSIRLSRVLINAGIKTDLRIWQGLWHVFECYDELPEAAQSLRELSGFLRG